MYHPKSKRSTDVLWDLCAALPGLKAVTDWVSAGKGDQIVKKQKHCFIMNRACNYSA